MKKHIMPFGVAMTLAASLWLGIPFHAARAAHTPRPAHPMPDGAGLCGDSNYLYMVRAGQILQFLKTDPSKVNNSAELPRPPLPSKAPSNTKETSSELLPPPPPGGACWVDGDSSLYVVSGPLLLQYEASSLELKSKIELPRPDSPSTSTNP